MGWIKRNLFFVIGGVLALGLLGAAGFYDWQAWKRNTDSFNKLQDIYNQLTNITKQKPSPGNKEHNNIQAAKDQDQELRDWISQAQNYFQPIPPIPAVTNGAVTSELFGTALHRTLDQLTRDAARASVVVPPDYSFSFQALRDRVTFSPGGLDALATQMGEVKAICGVLYAARVNELDGIQRSHASDDDANGPPTDYLADMPVTNNLAVITPYIVTFRSFSPEVAQVLSGFASSPSAFVVTGINIQPAAGVMNPGNPQPSPVVLPTMGGLQTVIQEQLLRVTIEVEIVKLLPRS